MDILLRRLLKTAAKPVAEQRGSTFTGAAISS